MSINKKDILASLLCGEIASWFLIFVIKNPYIEEFRGLAKIGVLLWALPFVLPIIFLLGVIVAEWLSKIFQIFKQIIRFGEVGILNTFIDFGILNLLIGVTGITSGWGLAPFNTISFLFGVTNSYFWNKLWTFDKGGKTGGKEFFQFLIVSAVGWGINTGIVVLGTIYITPLASISAGAWANIMKIVATLVSMAWNFIGYKFIVFRK